MFSRGRRPTLPKQPKQRKSQLKKFGAPVAGWIANRSLADPSSIEGQGAAVLDNFFPKATSVVMRRGAARYATTVGEGEAIESIFAYNNGFNQKLFAATADTIWDVTSPANPDNLLLGTETGEYLETENGDYLGYYSVLNQDVMTGFGGGDWVVTQFATTGGVYLIGVNGVDTGFLYDGTDFRPYDGSNSMPVPNFPNGLTIADMSFVWVYANRLWFAQKGSMNAYYIKLADAIGGDADIFPLSGIFTQGGILQFGASWSLESGGDGGLSDQCVFVSSEGQAAIFQGKNPDDASDWKQAGLYRIGNPLGHKAFFSGGGDLAICTSVGLVPLSQAIQLEVTALSVATVSHKIADAWGEAVLSNPGDRWQAIVWGEQKMAVIAPTSITGLDAFSCFVSNTETGAWARFTGWDVRCMATFKGAMYFGTSGGRVMQALVGGSDDGRAYTAAALPLFEDFGVSASLKIGTVGRPIVKATTQPNDTIALRVNYNDTLPPSPDATVASVGAGWGSAKWGQGTWGNASLTLVDHRWRSIGGAGYTMSLAYQVTSGASNPLDVELISLEMLYTTAEFVS